MKKINKTTKIKNFCRLGISLRNSKKALIFNPSLVLITIICLSILLIKLPDPEEYRIGKNQSDLINSYQQGETISFYIEQSAKLALIESVYNLSKDFSTCGTNENYNLRLSEVSCIPVNDIQKKTKEKFKVNFNKYLQINDKTKSLEDNYEFSLNNKNNNLEIIGIAKNPLLLSEEITVYNYSIRPNFRIQIDYNMGEYATLNNEFEEIIGQLEECKTETTIRAACVESKAQEKKDNFIWSFEGSVGNLLRFSAKSKYKSIFHNETLTYKLATEI